MKQLLKWAGGKSWLVSDYSHLLLPPKSISGRFFSTFLGAGAVEAQYMGAIPCVLSDLNRRLMVMYEGVRDDRDVVLSYLRRLTYDKETYYRVRRDFNHPHGLTYPFEVAAQLIYLNHTCFNGLYRENRDGEFNVPIGRFANPNFCDEATIRMWCSFLNSDGVELKTISWEPALADCREGDFLFLDPPYAPRNKTSNFTAYQAGGFGSEDQKRLAARLPELDRKGVKFLLTNAEEAKDFYRGWDITTVPVARNINSKGSKRGAVNEIIVRNYVSQ